MRKSINLEPIQLLCLDYKRGIIHSIPYGGLYSFGMMVTFR